MNILFESTELPKSACLSVWLFCVRLRVMQNCTGELDTVTLKSSPHSFENEANKGISRPHGK